MGALAALFAAERQRVLDVFDQLKQATDQLTPPPIAVWVEGSAAVESDDANEPLRVRLVDTEKHLRENTRRLRANLVSLQKNLDVTIEVSGSTKADLLAIRTNDANHGLLQLSTARSISGLPPIAFLPQTEIGQRARDATAHGQLDAYSLKVTLHIASMIKRDPSVIRQAMEFLTRRIPKSSLHERQDLQEWRELLETATPARVRRFLTDNGEHATRLRQSSPFVGMMSQKDRTKLLASFGEVKRDVAP